MKEKLEKFVLSSTVIAVLAGAGAIFVSLFDLNDILFRSNFYIVIIVSVVGVIISASIQFLLTRRSYSEGRISQWLESMEEEQFATISSSLIRATEIKLTDTLTAEDEIKFEVVNVVREVKEAQKAIENQDNLVLSEEVLNAIDDIISKAEEDPSIALMYLWVKIEAQMRKLLSDTRIDKANAYTFSNSTIDKAVEEGILPLQTASAFRDFRTVRNRIAHDSAFDISDANILSLVSIGIELLKILSARKEEDQEVNLDK